MRLRIFQVDAFSSEVFGGNPAAVIPLESWLDDDIMQKIGTENNLSETAFLARDGDEYGLRWFTPQVEVDLCGHATLATAHVLFNHLKVDRDILKFNTRSGQLIVKKDGDLIQMNFPCASVESIPIPKVIPQGLGAQPLEAFKASDLMLIFKTQKEIESMTPDFGVLKTLDARGIIVTAPGETCDFVSRFFAPRVGINEDPVTGSAHTMLIPFWQKRLGKDKLHAWQISDRRGELFCEYQQDRVQISGHAVTFMEGEIFLENKS